MKGDMIALARRAVACRGWRWMLGAATDSKFARIVATDAEGAPCAAEEGASEDDCYAVWLDGVPVLPDLTDPATLGCLLALVREAWKDPAYLWGGHAEVRRDSETLFVVLRFGHDANGFLVERWVASGATEAEALVAALEGAP